MERPDTLVAEVFSHFQGRRDELIPVLQETQAVFGYLPEEAMRSISRFMRMPESQVYGVATFYSQFHFARRGKHKVRVCCGTACHVAGATRVLETFERELGIACGCTSEDYEYSLERVACVGSCALSPVVVVDGEVFAQVDPSKVLDIVRK